MKDYYKNKIVWITGASSGIGEALVIELNKVGAKLIISSRNREALYKVKSKCQKIIDVHVLPLDLDQVESLSDKTTDALKIFGRIDCIIHSGGMSQRASAIETTLETSRRIMNVNYFGTVAITNALLPKMIEINLGQIVVISSLVGKFGLPKRSSYSASKHALHGYFDSLRAEIYKSDIGISIICPGFIKTNLSFNALIGTGERQNKMDDAQANGMLPQECAKRILKAVANKKQEVYIGGKEVYGVFLKRFFPFIFSKIIRKARVV